jgi:hypothetical protein
MTAKWGERNEVTSDEVIELVSRFLPPGQARAEKIANEFLVFWSPRAAPQRVFIGRSEESFDDAYHALIARCARQFMIQAARTQALAPGGREHHRGSADAGSRGTGRPSGSAHLR